MLGEKLDQHGSKVWLVNTGWTGGSFGEGERMPINATRTMLRAALSGDLDSAEFRTDEFFGLEVPLHVSGVDDSLLDPRSTWRDPELYDVKARKLAVMFAENFAKRFSDVDASIRAAGPNV
jgi:phosphoenolpyruvate carboxykinase (ATP)